MTFAYFDTSALVKRYIRERGSVRVMSLMRRHDLLSSAITPVEVLSALSRRRRSGDLSEEDFTATLGRVQSERMRWELVEAGEAVLSGAEKIVQGSRAHENLRRGSCRFIDSVSGRFFDANSIRNGRRAPA